LQALTELLHKFVTVGNIWYNPCFGINRDTISQSDNDSRSEIPGHF